MSQLPGLPVTYTHPRGQAVKLALFSIGLCSALWLMVAETNPMGRWFILGMGVAFGVALIIHSDPRVSYLKLTTEGFEFRTLRGKVFVAWKNVQTFATFVQGKGSWVTWYYTPEAKAELGAWAPRGIGSTDGSDGTIPGSFGHQPERLTMLMNDMLGAYGQPSLRNR